MAPEYTKKLLILVSVFLVIFLSFFFLFWRPGYADLRVHQRKLSAKEAELMKLEDDARDWPKTITRERLNLYENELMKLWTLIPPQEEVSKLLDEIQSHVKGTNLEIISLVRSSNNRNKSRTPKASEANDPRYAKVQYKITLTGSYFGLIEFLHRFEESQRLVTITNINMSTVDKSVAMLGNYPVSAEIQFNVYHTKTGVEKIER